ncbi:hypothetical protein tpqmel_0133 [Candidatus Gastranaerophilus sp. (ex Termes propinquus)]|nr:hypothetical protein tpqmel_0133 [Candidatus Gastranaerophilus sp. (ex Termes propinquus)]
MKKIAAKFTSKFTYFLLLILAVFALLPQEAIASRLPDDVWEYIKKELPGATQRFDSVVVVKKDIMYVPLYPAQREDVEKLVIEYAYPAAKSLAQLPEVVIFNNNFVLLKIFKKNGEFTVTSQQDLPIKVKLGLMPQDMLVPLGLVVPDNLKLILGDLNIPTKSEGSLAIDKTGESKEMIVTEGSFIDAEKVFLPLVELKNKKLFVTQSGSKFVTVYDNDSKNPAYELKLSALPSKILASDTTRFAVVVYFANKNIEVIDLQNERVLNQIPTQDTAKDVVIDNVKNVAYVSVPGANSICIVDLNSGKLTKTIKLTQAPGMLALSRDRAHLAFIDNMTQELYYMELYDEHITRQVAPAPNVAKIIFDSDKIYAISRVKNKMDVYDPFMGATLDSVKLSKKPVDAVLHDGKIYILCAQDSVVNVYDTAEKKMLATVKLAGSGFYSKITLVPNQQSALVTGVNTGKCLVLDLVHKKITRSQPFEVKVSNVVVVDK